MEEMRLKADDSGFLSGELPVTLTPMLTLARPISCLYWAREWVAQRPAILVLADEDDEEDAVFLLVALALVPVLLEVVDVFFATAADAVFVNGVL